VSRVLGCRVSMSGFSDSILKSDKGFATEMNHLALNCRECRVFWREEPPYGMDRRDRDERRAICVAERGSGRLSLISSSALA
jgi:hypothetical protein